MGEIGELFLSPELGEYFGGEISGFLIGIGIAFALLFFAAVYIYTSWAWMSIARKLKYKRPWLAWIPIANFAMILQLGSFHWAWVFLVLIPVLGWIALFILLLIASWRIFEDRHYPGWYSLSAVIPQVGIILYLVALGFVAWYDKEEESQKSSRKTSPGRKTKRK